MRKSFAPAKIILCGEYAVVFGFPGIALPATCGIEVVYQENLGKPDLTLQWEGAHPTWLKYAVHILDLCREQNDHLFGSVTITASAPLGKGMGSSTALVIALCRAVLGEGCKAAAKHIEDTLTPGNSGIDFAVIWENKPILFRKGKPCQEVSLPQTLLDNALLIDTGTPHETTADLVAWMEECQEERREALQKIGNCAERIVRGEAIGDVLRDHHRAQVELGIVPPAVQSLIHNIESQGGTAKVIGAGGRTGGGGMVLAFVKDVSFLHTSYPSFSIVQ